MKNTIFKKPMFLFFLLISFLSTSIAANNLDAGTQSIFDAIAYQELIEVDLEMDMEKVFGDKRNAEKHKAVFSFRDRNDSTSQWNIKVELRGKFRRMKCENLPPLKLNFKKSELSEAGLSKYDDLKLVTHCVEDDDEAKQLLVKEYLSYKLYNQITQFSFRVQLLKINYKDSVTGEVMQQYGFLIEDTAQVRNRLNAEKKEDAYYLPKEKYNVPQIKVAAMFNYMIGNSDWCIKNQKNVKVLLRNGRCIILPYDFDFSGLVDAPYAVAKTEHGIDTPKQRVYLGFPDDVNDLNSTMRIFEKNKEKFFEIISDCELLDKESKSKMLKYIQSFYEGGDYINLPKE